MFYSFEYVVQMCGCIVELVCCLFNCYGFEQVIIDQIMVVVGFICGVFYYYFQSKNELYVVVVVSFIICNLFVVQIVEVVEQFWDLC